MTRHALFVALAFVGTTLPAAAEIVVTFPDAGLEAAVRSFLGKPTGDIYDTDMQTLTVLSAQFSFIVDLTGLEYATNLSMLDLPDNSISDLTPLAGLSSLTQLGLWNNNISDLTPLSGLTSLNELSLSGNNISDLTPLSGLTSINILWLNGSNISDLAPGQSHLISNPTNAPAG